jgi:hypothetical protein
VIDRLGIEDRQLVDVPRSGQARDRDGAPTCVEEALDYVEAVRRDERLRPGSEFASQPPSY